MRLLCGDTTVALGRQILGKPADADEARAFCKKCQVVAIVYHVSCCEKGGHHLAEGLRKHCQMKVLAPLVTPICPRAIGRAKQADTVSKVPQGRLCHGSWILFRNHGFACGGNLCAVKRRWHFNIRSEMMKDVKSFWII